MERAGYQRGDRKLWYWLIYLSLVSYIALIGIFAIEELNGRDETLRVLLAEEARLGVEGNHNEEIKALRGLRQSLVALVVSGAVEQTGQAITLREIQCQMVRLWKESITCPEPQEDSRTAEIIRLASRALLKELSATAGSGRILAVLIVVASIGGALITLSLERDHEESPLRTVLRAMGGGIVCYLAVDGGSIPLSVGDISKIANPATASLYGFLAGMFSEKVFRLLSDLVDAFLLRLKPSQGNEAKSNQQGNSSAQRADPGGNNAKGSQQKNAQDEGNHGEGGQQENGPARPEVAGGNDGKGGRQKNASEVIPLAGGSR